VSKEKR